MDKPLRPFSLINYLYINMIEHYNVKIGVNCRKEKRIEELQ